MATYLTTSYHRPSAAAYRREQRMQSEVPAKVRLIICCDGTGNTPTSRTNVRRIWECLLGTKVDGSLAENDSNRVGTNPWADTKDDWQTYWPDGHQQICFYQVGILKGQGLGQEIHSKISEAYKFICDNWTSAEGNEIVLIGFSRGGFACQALANFLSMYGVMQLTDWEAFREIYKEWLQRQEQDFPNGFQQDARLGYRISTQGANLGKLPAYARSQPVKACALFDSVTGLDTTLAAMAGVVLGRRGDHLTFSHHHLPANIQSAYHALSINEHRQDFRPVLWANKLPHQELIQTWFPGFHSDIGGGASNVSRSIIPDLTFIWMVNHLHQKVRIHIGQVVETCWQQTPTTSGIKDSRDLMWRLFATEEERFEYLTALGNSQPFSTPTHAPIIEFEPNWEAYFPGLNAAEWNAAVTRAAETAEDFHWSVERWREIIRLRTRSTAFNDLVRLESNGRWYWASSKREGKVYWEAAPNWLEGLLGATVH